MAIVRGAVMAMAKTMTEEQIACARAAAEREILAMKLADLRQRHGGAQLDTPRR
jgi:hypothetical protein